MLECKQKTKSNRIIQGEQTATEQPDVNQENGAHENGEENAEEPAENGTINHDDDQETNDETNAKDTSDPVMEIEGVVHGEADNNVVQSASRFTAVDDEDNKV